jgi:hypothetical protein
MLASTVNAARCILWDECRAGRAANQLGQIDRIQHSNPVPMVLAVRRQMI